MAHNVADLWMVLCELLLHWSQLVLAGSFVWALIW